MPADYRGDYSNPYVMLWLINDLTAMRGNGLMLAVSSYVFVKQSVKCSHSLGNVYIMNNELSL